MSNAQAGTRLTSSSDWTRLMKLRLVGKGSWNNAANTTAKPAANQSTYGTALMIPKTTGTSRNRNMASDWTNYVAYNTADYVLQTQPSSTNVGKTLTAFKVCTCDAPPYTPKKVGLCAKCIQPSK
jgi:hypothetical protein